MVSAGSTSGTASMTRCAISASTWSRTAGSTVRFASCGEPRPPLPVEVGRRLAGTFPSAEFHEVHDAPTFVPMDRPDDVAAAIRAVVVGASRLRLRSCDGPDGNGDGSSG